MKNKIEKIVVHKIKSGYVKFNRDNPSIVDIEDATKFDSFIDAKSAIKKNIGDKFQKDFEIQKVTYIIEKFDPMIGFFKKINNNDLKDMNIAFNYQLIYPDKKLPKKYQSKLDHFIKDASDQKILYNEQHFFSVLNKIFLERFCEKD